MYDVSNYLTQDQGAAILRVKCAKAQVLVSAEFPQPIVGAFQN
jgi:hypothetical protein